MLVGGVVFLGSYLLVELDWFGLKETRLWPSHGLILLQPLILYSQGYGFYSNNLKLFFFFGYTTRYIQN